MWSQGFSLNFNNENDFSEIHYALDRILLPIRKLEGSKLFVLPSKHLNLLARMVIEEITGWIESAYILIHVVESAAARYLGQDTLDHETQQDKDNLKQ